LLYDAGVMMLRQAVTLSVDVDWARNGHRF
jgi:hypothetical protein